MFDGPTYRPCQHNLCHKTKEQISNNPSMRDPICQKLKKELQGKPKVLKITN